MSSSQKEEEEEKKPLARPAKGRKTSKPKNKPKKKKSKTADEAEEKVEETVEDDGGKSREESTDADAEDGSESEAKAKPGRFKPLSKGAVVKAGGNKYRVDKKIGARQYRVKKDGTSKSFFMKIAPLNSTHDAKQLQADISVLEGAAKLNKRFREHFLEFTVKDRSTSGGYKFIILTLGDDDLDAVRANALDNADFSKKDAGRLSLQTFQAIHNLHHLGYVHRSIRPSHFVFGVSNAQRVFLVGLSMAVSLSKDESKRGAVAKVKPFRRFRPRGYHRSRALYSKDDLESWLYTCIHLFGQKLLPWTEEQDEFNMHASKQRLFCDEHKDIAGKVPVELLEIADNLDKGDYAEQPDYVFIGIQLLRMKQALGFSAKGLFDWQLGDKASQKETTNDETADEPAPLPPKSPAKKKSNSKKVAPAPARTETKVKKEPVPKSTPSKEKEKTVTETEDSAQDPDSDEPAAKPNAQAPEASESVSTDAKDKAPEGPVQSTYAGPK